ncbi:hypothetical protein CDAR_292751 [Caerostris darwini]|uniref:Uncharacterized protein n=1 Tax=Caerostris darwini TaxID=1538125 RepID=A0AAV4SHV7_9ARAC|nr:hypothetical protein CDAR_292751 [Caerostris darwini]
MNAPKNPRFSREDCATVHSLLHIKTTVAPRDHLLPMRDCRLTRDHKNLTFISRPLFHFRLDCVAVCAGDERSEKPILILSPCLSLKRKRGSMSLKGYSLLERSQAARNRIFMCTPRTVYCTLINSYPVENIVKPHIMHLSKRKPSSDPSQQVPH